MTTEAEIMLLGLLQTEMQKQGRLLMVMSILLTVIATQLGISAIGLLP